jgi:hypothetical protein
MDSIVGEGIRVISVRDRDRAALLADPDFVYVGRRCAGWPASPFANPFKVADFPGGPRAAVAHYAAHLRSGSVYARGVLAALPSLRGKTLGCWCGSWSPGEPEIACHAVVLARLADGMIESP